MEESRTSSNWEEKGFQRRNECSRYQRNEQEYTRRQSAEERIPHGERQGFPHEEHRDLRQ